MAGRYRIEAPIGEGGMGVVYRVRHIHTDEALAMKVLHAHVLRDESAVERFRREARAPARIGSDHVARVTDADTAPDLANAPFYVMELLQGMDLERLVNEQGPLPAHVVVELLRQAARALDKAHALGIVHRDLKPENLFLTHKDDGSPWIKLLDFGIARIAVDTASHKKTQAGYIFGTPAYMAPEQAVGDVELIGPATDIWALGLVAFKLLTGHDFWDAHSTGQLIAMAVSAPIPSPTERGATLGPGFDHWFAGCVTRAISDRFSTASDAVAALAESLSIALAPSIPAPPLKGPRSSAGDFAAAPWHMRTSSASPVSLSHVSEAALRRPAGSRARIVAAALVAALVVALAIVIVVRFSSRAAPANGIAKVAAVPITTASDAAADGATSARAEERIVEVPSATPSASAEAELPKPSAPNVRAPRSLTRSQEKRLGVLQRLCSQGTFTPDECKTKQAAILREQ